jgi:5'-nucleotidase
MIVLVDMDGVLANWDKHYGEMLALHFPEAVQIPYEERPFMNPQRVMSEQERTIQSLPGYYRHLEPIEGGREALEELEANGHDVLLCSTPAPLNATCASDKYAWVEEHLGKKWVKRTILTHDKTLVLGDVLVDDKPVITGINEFPTWIHVLFDQPYNQHSDAEFRMEGWEELGVIFEALAVRSAPISFGWPGLDPTTWRRSCG